GRAFRAAHLRASTDLCSGSECHSRIGHCIVAHHVSARAPRSAAVAPIIAGERPQVHRPACDTGKEPHRPEAIPRDATVSPKARPATLEGINRQEGVSWTEPD